jgi:hypothetical protein
MKFTLKLKCDSELPTPEFNLVQDSLLTPCDLTVLMKTTHGKVPVLTFLGCPTLLRNGLFKFTDEYALPIGIIGIVLGMLFLLFGLPWYKITLFFWGVVNTVISIMMFLYFVILS